MPTIAVTGFGWDNNLPSLGQGVIKTLRAIPSLNAQIIALHHEVLAAEIYCADQIQLIPSPDNSQYFNNVIEVMNQYQVDCFIPTLESEILFWQQKRTDFAKQTRSQLLIANNELIRIASDKYQTYQFLIEHNFATPKSFIASDVDISSLDYPLYLKPRCSYGSQGCRIIHDQKELQQALSVYDPCTLLIQEIIGNPEQEYTCTVVKTNQDYAAIVLERKLLGGYTYAAKAIDNPVIKNYVLTLAAALNVDFPCNFQLRLDNHQPKLLEINSRCSGTIYISALLGFNALALYLKDQFGIHYHPQVQYDKTVIRTFDEMIIDNKTIDTLQHQGHVELS
jgi:carbamoyl-phosphate synthase large subunit